MNCPSGKRPHLLLFEPNAQGHATEWVEYIADWLARTEAELTVSLAVPPSLIDEVTTSLRRGLPSTVRPLPFTALEMAVCNNGFLPLSGFGRWWTMRRKLRATDADCGVFLCIDHLSLPFGLGLKADGRAITGILFRPSVHYPRDPDLPVSLRERLRNLRKDILYRLMFRNDAIRTVWSLDPHFPAFAARRYSNGGKVRSIGDPIRGFDTVRKEGTVSSTRASRGARTLFLIFGFLSERKGVITLVDALRRLEAGYAGSVAVIAAGAIDPAIVAPLKEALEELRDARPEVWLRFDSRRLSTGEIAGLVAEADVVLAPYQRFVGSSGVMLWAASAGKPVITQDYGLLGRLTRDYRLGLAVDTTNASELAAAIITAVKLGPKSLADTAGMARFVSGHSPDIFASRIIEDAAGHTPPRTARHSGRTGRTAATD